MIATVEDALLADIRENPKDDTPRLVMADYLDERGEPERAEFIRAQIELERLPECPTGDATPFAHILCRLGCRRCACRQDQVRLLVDIYSRLVCDAAGYGVAVTAGYYEPNNPLMKLFPPFGTVGSSKEIANVTFRRGFVDAVRFHTLADCLKHMRAVCGSHPVMRVEAADRVPRRVDFSEPYRIPAETVWGWGRQDGEHPFLLTPRVWDEVIRHLEAKVTMHVVDFPSEKIALDALSAALLSLARGG